MHKNICEYIISVYFDYYFHSHHQPSIIYRDFYIVYNVMKYNMLCKEAHALYARIIILHAFQLQSLDMWTTLKC